MAQGENTTLSQFYINVFFKCYLLEDSIRDVKVHSATCIPEGLYKLELNIGAGMNNNYKKRYPGLHKGMVEIVGIPDFSLVFIHIGNHHQETKGCPLTGRYWKFSDGDYRVLQSALAYGSLYPELLKIMDEGSARIEVINRLGL
jgi:hypothetical protein